MTVRRSTLYRNVLLAFFGLVMAASELVGQAGFVVTGVSVSRRALPFNGTEYSVNSIATYPQSGWLDRRCQPRNRDLP